jgi:iron complex transport system permease protein
MRSAIRFILPLALLAAVAAASLAWGPYPAWTGLSEGDPWAWTVLADLRLPRLLTALFAGAMLALAGAVFQSILSNPLGDPYVLGVSGGAASGAVLALLLGAGRGGPAMAVLAFAGACATAAAVYGLASRDGEPDPVRLVLAGVILNALHTAFILFALSLLGTVETGAFVRWMMGSVSGLTLGGSLLLGAALGLIGLPVLLLHRGFDLVAQGREEASALGLSTRPFLLFAFAAASALAAATVAAAGIIGFVGLVAPNLVRLAWGGRHRTLLPLAMLWGAVFLGGADLLTRLPRLADVPVGAVAALIGVPYFLYVLRSWR